MEELFYFHIENYLMRLIWSFSTTCMSKISTVQMATKVYCRPVGVKPRAKLVTN